MDEAFDVVVIGGGLAGMSAAIGCAEAGLRVVALEQGEGEAYLCNTRITMGFFQIALNDIRGDAAALRQAIDRATRGHVAPAIADAFASSAGPAMAWLQAQGVELVRGGDDPSNTAQLAPAVPHKPGLHWRGRGGDVMLRRLGATLAARGGALRPGWRARELIIAGGRCAGVVATAGSATHRLAARAVVIADGGFQANRDLVRRHISPRPDRLLQRNAGTGRGDGVTMAEAAGAATTGMDRFYGHVQARDAMDDLGLWPYPTLDYPISAGIAVTGDGRRFTDEGLGGVAVANAIARLDDPLDTVAVFDEAAWEASGKLFVMSANPHLVECGATFHRADSLAELAARAALAPDTLAATVAAFNRAIDEHALARLDPARSEESGTPWGSRPIPIRRPPFYAVPLCAGITYTMGGVAIDPDARILNRSGDPIPGLYGAGGSIGGTEGGPVTGYTGGLAKALVFGWRAAGAILRDRVG
jgi:fumarate reductase flavoprotein subunit